MAMKLVRKTAEYKIFLRGDNRYAVQNANGKPVNGEEKVNILIAEELIKVTAPTEQRLTSKRQLKKLPRRPPKRWHLPERAC